MVKTIDQLQDFRGTLEELSRIVNFLKDDYGGDTLVWFETHFDDIEVVIETTDKMYGE